MSGGIICILNVAPTVCTNPLRPKEHVVLMRSRGQYAGKGFKESDTASTVLASSIVKGLDNDCVVHDEFVRQLTEREYERLQGFPDDYTRIDWSGRAKLRNLRYKAIGNSMAVPVIRAIGAAISEVEG